MCCSHFPNAVAKASGSQSMLVGEEILKQLDVSSIALRRPVDRGYVVHWDVQKDIWSSSFKKLLSGKKQDSLGIVLTEPYLNLSSMRDRCMKILLEDMKFSSVLMLYPATLCMHYLSHLARESETLSPARLALRAGAGVVIDAGFSFTHIVPMFDWKPIKRSIRRIDLGGKALTNYMKELVSYRSMNMMKETYLMEHIKDELCFVSHNVEKDLKASKSKKSPFRTEWFLPDGVTSKWGHIRDPSQPRDPSDPILVVNNERFMVPEALFHPSGMILRVRGGDCFILAFRFDALVDIWRGLECRYWNGGGWPGRGSFASSAIGTPKPTWTFIFKCSGNWWDGKMSWLQGTIV